MYLFLWPVKDGYVSSRYEHIEGQIDALLVLVFLSDLLTVTKVQNINALIN